MEHNSSRNTYRGKIAQFNVFPAEQEVYLSSQSDEEVKM
jgi:hypothetical protein